jgi:hypothetical protein
MDIESLMKSSFFIEENNRNVHTFRSYYDKDISKWVLLLTDVHWDNPKCDWDLLKKHLDQAVAKNAKIIINGDLFCLMQGWGDPRGTKSDIRPEHNSGNYLDSIVQTAVEWWAPYVNHLTVIGRGNHEQSVLKRKETDILNRFVDLLNLTYRPIQNVKVGGYGGWVRFLFDRENAETKAIKTIKMKYYHGSGKDAEVTQGMIGNHRRQSFISGADIIWSGHIHNNVSATFAYETLTLRGNVEIRETEHIISATYKEEYADGYAGFHVERGARPKPLGGVWLEFYYEDNDVKFRHHRAK